MLYMHVRVCPCTCTDKFLVWTRLTVGGISLVVLLDDTRRRVHSWCVTRWKWGLLYKDTSKIVFFNRECLLGLQWEGRCHEDRGNVIFRGPEEETSDKPTTTCQGVKRGRRNETWWFVGVVSIFMTSKWDEYFCETLRMFRLWASSVERLRVGRPLLTEVLLKIRGWKWFSPLQNFSTIHPPQFTGLLLSSP